MAKLRLVVSLMLCLAVVTASPRYRRQSPSTLSLSTSSFGTSLYTRLASNNENIIYSPLSVYTALSMVLLGSRGDTEQELRTTLGAQPGSSVHSDLYDLMTSMTTNDPDSNLTVRMANALYYDPAQVMVLERHHGGRDANFTTMSGLVKQVSMMYKVDSFSVKNVPELEARVLELPYKGGNYSLFIILPNTKNGVRKLERKLNGQKLESAVTSMPPTQRYRVYVPKFYLRLRTDLVAPLQALGLRAMFDSSRANFSGMVIDPRGLAVSEAIHEAMIQVTESGTKAAAVTMISIGRTSAVISPAPLVFDADHAFLIVLRNKVNRVNLFVGRVADPSLGEQ